MAVTLTIEKKQETLNLCTEAKLAPLLLLGN